MMIQAGISALLLACIFTFFSPPPSNWWPPSSLTIGVTAGIGGFLLALLLRHTLPLVVLSNILHKVVAKLSTHAQCFLLRPNGSDSATHSSSLPAPNALPSSLTSSAATPSAAAGPFDIQHLMLNIEWESIPAWCNIGYWNTSSIDQHQKEGETTSNSNLRVDAEVGQSYSDACAQLVRELAAFIGLPRRSVVVDPASNSPPAGTNSLTRILDVGCGCGEQDFLLWREYEVSRIHAVNISEQQIQWAKRRREWMKRQGLKYDLKRGTSDVHADDGQERKIDECIHFHVSSAADLQSLRDSGAFDAHRDTDSSSLPSSSPEATNASTRFSHVLAIDCAYHFAPSRLDFLQHALRNELEDGGMVGLVDLFPITAAAADRDGQGGKTPPSWWRSMILRFVAHLCSIPLPNLISLEETIREMQAMGYQELEVRDISSQMLEPFASYILDTLPAAGTNNAFNPWFRPHLWIRYRVTAHICRWIARRNLAQFVMIKARKRSLTSGKTTSIRDSP